MIYCCGCYFATEEHNRKLKLYDNTTHKERVLEVDICPKCKAQKAYIKQVRIEDGKYGEKKPKNSKEVSKFIKKYKKEVYYEVPNLTVKTGTRGNMGWCYVDTTKSSWVKDFNNVRQFKVSKDYRVVS